MPFLGEKALTLVLYPMGNGIYRVMVLKKRKPLYGKTKSTHKR